MQTLIEQLNKIKGEVQELKKEEDFINYNASSTTRAIVVKKIELGGIYSVTMSYRHNTGSPYYRSVLHGILSIPCRI